MKRLLVLALALFVSVGACFLPGSAALGQAQTVVSGKVTAQVDPFLLLKNIIRLAPTRSAEILDLVVPEFELPLILNAVLKPLLEPILCKEISLTSPINKDFLIDAIVNMEDPEQMIVLIEKILPAEIIEDLFSNIDPAIIAVLIPNLPDALKNLLASLLPNSIDLNFVPLAGARVVILNQSGKQVAASTTPVSGKFSFSLSPGGYTLRATLLGYEGKVVENDLLGSNMNVIMEPKAGIISGLVLNESNRVVKGAKVRILSSDGIKEGTTNALGLYSIKDVKPLLPSIGGGMGIHVVKVDADGYFLQEKKGFFLLGGSIVNFKLQKAPLFGTITGKVTKLNLLSVQIPAEGATVELRDEWGNVIATTETLSGTPCDDGTYEFADIAVGTYTVAFVTSGGDLLETGVEVKAGRETEVDKCVSLPSVSGYVSTKGTIPWPIKNVTVIIKNATNTYTTKTSTLGFYSLDNILPGVYTVEFYKSTNLTTPAATVENVVLDLCGAPVVLNQQLP